MFTLSPDGLAANPARPSVAPLRVRRLPRPGRGISVFSSPSVDALDAASSLSPLSATLTENTRGGGTSPASPDNSSRNPSVFNSQLSTFNSFPSDLSSFNFKPLALLTLRKVGRNEGRNEGSMVEGSTFNGFSPKSSRIRTSAKPARNPFRMCTSKTKDLKPIRMSTSEKTGMGGWCGSSNGPKHRLVSPSGRSAPCQLSTPSTHYSLPLLTPPRLTKPHPSFNVTCLSDTEKEQ
jgi:hypothetical protein